MFNDKMPKWARQVAIEVLETYPQAREQKYPTSIRWRKYKRFDSSGCCYAYKIVVCAGRDRFTQKLVLLHELAHWLRPRRQGHDAEFWRIAWQLYRQYKLPVKKVLKREADIKGCAIAYKNSLKNN